MERASDIQELQDKQALYEIVVRLARGMDQGDEALMASCYHPDATDDHGHLGEISAANFIRFIIDVVHGRGGLQRHLVSNAHFEVEGDGAHGEICVTVQIIDREENLQHSLSRYFDRYERRDGEWRIAYRRMINEWRSGGLAKNAPSTTGA